MLSGAATPKHPFVHSRRTGHTAERGSVAVAMIVLMICAALAGVLVTRNLSAARDSVRSEHRIEALALTDVGIVEAEARILDGERSFDDTGDLGAGSWSVTVRPLGQGDDPDLLEVTAVASVEDQTRAAAVTVQADRRSIARLAWSEVPVPRS